MSGALYWRLVIRNADDSADLLVLSSYPGDTNCCLASPPSGDGQRIDPITGKSSIGAYTIRTVDVVTSGTNRVVTSKLVDARKRQQLIGCRAYVKYSTDGTTWSVLVAGFVNRVRLVGALTYEFTVGETQRVEENLEIFKTVTPTYDQVSCICGGPVRGGFGPLRDYGPWKMRVAQVYADKFVRLKYLSGYQRRSRDTITEFHPLGGYEYVAGGITRYEDQRVNQISRSYYEPLPGYSAYGIAGYYPKLVVRVEDASGTLIGQFRPLNRIDWTITTGSVTIVGPHIALVDNSDLNVLWDGVNGDDGTGSAPDQPDDESIVYVYVYPEEIDENNPIHISGHPVDIITGLWADAGLAYSSADATTAKSALGTGLRYDLRITQSSKMGEFVQKICAAAGLGVRFNSSGERSLVSLRIPPSTSPTTTLTMDDLRSVEPPIFDVDEKSMVDKVTFKTESYSPWNPAKYGEDSAHPIDELVVTPQVASVVAEDADGEHETVFEIQGQIRVTGLPGIMQDRAWLGSGLNQAGVYAVSRAREIFDRRASGAIVSEIACVRGVTAVPGDEITLDIPHLPNDNDRGGERIVQVLGRTETPSGPTLYVEDAGVSVQPSTVPTYSIAKDTTADPKRYATISITNASSLITDGSNCRIEIATGASPTSWVHFATITPTEMGTVTSWRSPRVDAGAVVNVRMRAEEQGKRPSAYGTTKSVTLTALTAPTSLSAAAVTDDDTAADLTWTAGETLVPVVVQWKETADTVYDHSVTLPAGSTQYRVRGLEPGTAYTFKVFYQESPPWAGVSTSITDTLTTGSTAPDCTAPENPRAFAGSIDPTTGGTVIDGSYGLEVTATELPSFTVFEVAVETSAGAGTYGSYTAVPGGTIQSVQGARTTWHGLAPNDGKKRRLRAKHTAPGKDDSSYTPAVDIDPWTATAPTDYPVDIPSDFAVSSVVLGTQSGGVSVANATYTPPADTTGFDHMAYSVRARQTTSDDSAPWSAPSIVVGSADGNDQIPVTPGTDAEITPICVSQDGTTNVGTGTEIKTIEVPAFALPASSIVATAGSAAITYEVDDFGTAKYIRWYRKVFTSAAVPGSAVSVEGSGTEGMRFEPGGLESQQGLAIDATNEYELATFVPYDANNQRGAAINIKTHRATPVAPAAPTAAAAVSHTSSSVTNSVTMPADVSNADKIRVYRDGVKYGSDVTRTAAAGASQNVTSSGLMADTAYQWQYSLVHSADGGESAKTTAISVTTSPGTIPTPSIATMYYNTVTQQFGVVVDAAAGTPSGVTWHLEIGTGNPPTTEDTDAASTSNTLLSDSAQTGLATTFYARVWGTKSGWTTSSHSAVASAVRPAKAGGGV